MRVLRVGDRVRLLLGVGGNCRGTGAMLARRRARHTLGRTAPPTRNGAHVPRPPHSLVTGANRGLGLALVRQLLARGDRVVATARHPGKATALNTLTGEYPGRLHVLPLDVGDARNRATNWHANFRWSSRARASTCWSTTPASCTAANAGENCRTTCSKTACASMRSGRCCSCRRWRPLLADGATVANISTQMASLSTRNEFRSPSYSMSKAAQNMATVQLAKALAAARHRVVALAPAGCAPTWAAPAANSTPEESAAGLLQVIDRLRDADSGRFLDWRGQPMAW